MSNLIRLLGVVGLSLLLAGNAFSQQDFQQPFQSVALNVATEKGVPVASKLVRYVVQEQGVTDHQILSAPNQFNWHTIDKASINLGKNPNPIWFRFPVENTSDQAVERLLEIRWTHLSEVDFYQKKPNESGWHHYKAGLQRKKSEHFRDNPSYIFPITLQAGEKAELILRVNTSFYHFLPMTIWSEQSFADFQKTHFIYYALAFGVLMAMMLYNASLYVFTKDRLFLFYSFYVFGVTVYELCNSGLANYMLWGENDWMRENGFAVTVYISFLGVALFVRDFFGLNAKGGIEKFMNTFFVVFCLIGILDQVVGTYYLRSIAGAVIMLMCINLMGFSIKNALQGDIYARYFVVAWSVLVGFTFLNIATIEGYFADMQLANYGQLIGFVSEMLLLSFALADRINRERKQREQAQSKAIELQISMVKEREEKIATQNQVLKLQQQSNEQLEARVRERTKTLELTMENLKDVNIELSRLSVTDPLTKVHNRRYFDEVFQTEIMRSAHSGRSLSLILVDVDHFKQFNDRYGHLAGDDCLKMVASALRHAVSRENDMVARFGGEEFAIVLPETTEQQAYQVAEKIRKAIEDLRFVCRGERVPIRASLGVVSVIASSVTSAENLIQSADQALYQAKDQGRNCSVLAQLEAG